MTVSNAPTAAPRPERKPALRLLSVVVAIGVGLGLVVWKAWRDPDIAWLSREGRASWIRYPSPAATKAIFIVRMTTEFRTSFQVTGVPDHAGLRVRFFRRGLVRLNGQVVDLRHCGDAWKEPCQVEVSPLLQIGRNEVEVAADHDSGLPGCWLELRGPGVDLASDTTWDSSFAGGTWRKAVRASDPPGAPRTDPFDAALPPFRSLGQRWATLLSFALLSSLIVGASLAWARRRKAPAADPRSPLAWRIALGGVVLLWVALFAGNWAHLPVEWGFDAPAHLDYVAYILERGALPMPDEGWSMFHPPLYYAILAGIFRLAGASPLGPDAGACVRGLGFSIGIVNLVAVAVLVRRSIPDDPASQVVGVLTAGCLPLMLYLHQFPSNEILVAALSSVAILLAHDILEEGNWSFGRHAVLGGVIGLALLTKFNAFLLVPAVFGILLFRAVTGPRAEVARRLATIGASGLATVAVCGWHYGRIWARFGTPIVTGWEHRPGLGWWVDPGYRTVEHFTRFGRVFSQPLFAGYDSLWDGLYSTLWGDGLMSGLAAATPWPPWWSPSLQAAGYALALVPTLLALLGFFWTVWTWLRSPNATDGLLLSITFLVTIAFMIMTLRVPCVAQDKASYGLLALGPLCVFTARGFGLARQTHRWTGPTLLVALGTWALTSIATYRVEGSSTKVRVTHAMSADLSGEKPTAVRELRQVVRDTPTDWRPRLVLARILTEAGGSGAEVERLLVPDRSEPDIAPRHLAIALWQGSRGDFPGAVAAARRATALDPADADAWAVLGSALEAQRDLIGATRAWQEFLRIQPQDRSAHLALESLLSRQGEGRLAAVHQDYAARIPAR